MQWTDLIGHQQQKEWFRNALAARRLGSAFLFVGPHGIGKRSFALLLAKSLLCERRAAQGLEPCGTCSACTQVDARTHPDLLLVSKPEDKSFIPLETLVGPREARMQEGLCHDLHLRPLEGRRRIAILDDADHLNEEGANCLLKTLEEPPPAAMLILVGSNLQRQLPTIRSRCQIVRFAPPTGEDAVRLLQLQFPDASQQQLQEALEQTRGDVTRVGAVLSADASAFHAELHDLLEPDVPEATRLARTVSGYVDAAGSEAPKRRERLREVFRTAIDFYRDKMRSRSDEPSAAALHRRRLNCTLVALEAVDRNANQATLIESWSVELQSA